jgi:hypothetical protein
MTTILGGLIGLVLSYAAAFVLSSAIVQSWILFWDYGYIWNTLTVPPMLMWDIFFSNIPIISIIGLGIAIVIFLIGLFMLN